MYSNLSILTVCTPDYRNQMYENANTLLDAMEVGRIPYERAAWLEAEQMIHDVKTWAIHSAESRGLTNVTMATHK